MCPLYRIGGTLDLFAITNLSGKHFPALWERKTGAAPWWVPIQLAGYLQQFDDIHKFLRIGAELHADGTYKIIGPYLANSHQRHIQCWMAALTIYREWEGSK